jgi:hypothetical protein
MTCGIPVPADIYLIIDFSDICFMMVDNPPVSTGSRFETFNLKLGWIIQ